MSVMVIVYAVYALVLIGGGVMGFVKAGSKASLISGIVTGLIAGAAAGLHGSHRHLALYIGIGVSGLAAIIFIMRFLKTRKMMPAVPMFFISDVVLLASVLALLRKH